MKILAKILLSIFLTLSIVPLFACGSASYEHTFYAFNNTPIVVVTFDKDLTSTQQNEISAYLTGLENEFSVNKNSFVKEINDIGFSGEIELSNTATEVFEKCKALYEFTNGKFNPAVFPLVKLWSFSPNYPVQSFTPPLESEIDAVLKSGSISFSNFSLLNGKLSKLNPNSQIDFGGAVKGYAADGIASMLLSYGIEKGYVSIGSSSLKIMNMSAISVKHPRADGLIFKVNLNSAQNYSVSTSGDYERFYDYDGKRYSHIIDGETGYPSNTNVCSATIISSDGLSCDALSTALCLYPHDVNTPSNSALLEFISQILASEDYQNSQIFVVYDDGENKQVITNKKQGEDFTLLDNSYSVLEI